MESYSLQVIAKLFTALLICLSASTFADAKNLNTLFNENDSIYIGVKPIEGTLPEVSWIFVKNEDLQWTLVKNKVYYGVDQGPPLLILLI